MKSKITGGSTSLLFSQKILNKYDVSYYKCDETGFIQTEEPFWLEEAYSSAITKLDVGLVHRNITLAERVSKIITPHFNANGIFLDYAGGYGLFTRLMRDRGFNYHHTDMYCSNLFAEYFDIADLPPATSFNLVSAFEVFEHLANPIQAIQSMLKFSDNLLFTTALQPINTNDIKDWSYLSPETGQHVSFYTVKSLAYIAQSLGYSFYTDGEFLHLFTKQTFEPDILYPKRDSFLIRKAKKFIKKAEENKYGKLESLLMADWKYVKEKF
jgi:Methyltransferase domain